MHVALGQTGKTINLEYLRNLPSKGSEILTHVTARCPLSSRDFISRSLLTVWPLEGRVCRNLTLYISSYVRGTAVIFHRLIELDPL